MHLTGTQSTSPTRYLPAIDGLRAIAVGSVVLFHIWPGVLPGGYTGVDIFFVISGFVVTRSMIGREFATLGELTAHFYARRLLRIMPALVAMLLVTLLATQLFVPDAWLSNSVAQVARFAFFGLSNIVLATDSDSYFGPQAAYNPFTHTWSLGVEEQFYLLFPLLLWRCGRAGGVAWVTRLVAILSAASFLLCAVLTFVAAKFAFYLIVTRFWELGIGMLLCLTLPQWRGWAGRQRWLVPLGTLLVGAGFIVPEGAGFPFPFALLPVIGTAALVMAIVAARAPAILSSAPMTGLGRLSYSLYLWHWPVLALLRWTTGVHTLPLQLGALALSLLLAFASYRLVEQPLRHHPRLIARPARRTAWQAAAITALCALIGHGLIAAHDRITLSVTADRHAWYATPERVEPAARACPIAEQVTKVAGGKVTRWTAACHPSPAFTLFVPADSHGLAYAPALRRLAVDQGAEVRLYFRAGCPYLKLIESHASRPRCADWYAELARDVTARSRPGDVVFLPGLRVTRLANQFDGDRDLAGPRDDRVDGATLAEAARILATLRAGGAGLVMEMPKPVLPSPAFRCSDSFNRANPICRGLSVDRAATLTYRQPVTAAMRALQAAQPGLSLWDPLPLLCPGATCQAVPGGRPLFFDGDHISGLGNDRLYPGLRQAILAARSANQAGGRGT